MHHAPEYQQPHTRHALAAAQVALLALSCSGCGTVMSSASYTGTRYPPVVTAGQVREFVKLPDDHEVIGQVRASCSRSTGDVEWHDVLLSDILCSESRLVHTLRRKVAEVGGTALAERDCDKDTDTKSRTETKDGKDKVRSVTTTHIACEGTVARAKVESSPVAPEAVAGEATPPQGAASDPDEPDTDASTVAWRIRIQVTRGKDATQRPAVASEAVETLTERPAGTVAIANIVADCTRGCNEAAVQLGVREAAARIGATAVVAVSCRADGKSWICTGTAVAPRLAPPGGGAG
ncbi:MAG TPA: hypothetical protein PKD61_02820 [Polyangiaceae bacterium]|nr:hypothetical protein [Polyangiaceae bacterium]